LTGDELREWRTRLGLSQAGLAALLSVDANTVARWERDERAIPPFLHLALTELARRKR